LLSERDFTGRVYHGTVPEDIEEDGEVLLDQELDVRDKNTLVGGGFSIISQGCCS
jgi:hypothetical protein